MKLEEPLEAASTETCIEPTRRKSKRRTWLFLGTGLALAALFYGPALADLFPVIGAYLEKPDVRQYDGSRVKNLTELHRALSLVHENDGEYPDAKGWMDTLKTVIRTNDMPEEEALKKYRNPLLKSGFGYALNEAASKKYKGDLDPKTPLVYETADPAWNAHGNPATHPADAKAIAIDGTILTLP